MSELFIQHPTCVEPISFWVRIWKYDVHHAAYDLFAILVQTPPPMKVEPKGCCGTVMELAFGKAEVDYDKMDPVGVTAVAPVSSRFGTGDELAFNLNEKLRNGPIASGNWVPNRSCHSGNGPRYSMLQYSHF